MKKAVMAIAAIIVVIALIFSFVQSNPNFGQNQSGYFVDYACSGSAQCFTGTVTRIIDGDTIVVDDIHVRFALAAAPELSKSGGSEAKEFIENTCPVGSKVVIDEDDGQTGGSYGRTIAQIYCNNVSLNEALVSRGFGSIDTRFCSQSEFSEQDWARIDGC